MHSISFEAIGTSWQIDILSSLTQSQLSRIISKINKRISEFDKTYSRFRKDSWVTKLSKEKGIYPLPPDAAPLFSLYETLYELSNGVFTPVMGALLESAGYDRSYSLSPKVLTRPPALSDVYEVIDDSIIVKSPSLLDFGAGGKGYVIDIIGELLRKEDIDSFCIDAGGDILSQGDKTLKVGLENPLNFAQVVGSIEIKNQSICGSAGNRRKWDKYHHIMNPKTLTSPDDVLAVWVVAKTALLADALSTYLFLSSDTIKLKEFDFEYAILFSDFSLARSKGFKAKLYT